MKRRSRYFVIILGAVTFFVLSPIIVLYVSNLRYDFETQGYVIGGIITVKTTKTMALKASIRTIIGIGSMGRSVKVGNSI
jgi:hypothetical protein